MSMEVISRCIPKKSEISNFQDIDTYGLIRKGGVDKVVPTTIRLSGALDVVAGGAGRILVC